MDTTHTPPSEVAGVEVYVCGDPLTVNGEEWLTLAPEGDDERLWEFSLTTGRIIRMDV